MFAVRAKVADPLTGTMIGLPKVNTVDALGGVTVTLGEPPHEVQVSVIDENSVGWLTAIITEVMVSELALVFDTLNVPPATSACPAVTVVLPLAVTVTEAPGVGVAVGVAVGV
jgi:hypothetical protein